MSLSNEELEQRTGRNVFEVKTELEGLGYTVNLVSTGRCATGFVPEKILHMKDGVVEEEKRVVLSFSNDDPDKKVTSIHQD